MNTDQYGQVFYADGGYGETSYRSTGRSVFQQAKKCEEAEGLAGLMMLRGLLDKLFEASRGQDRKRAREAFDLHIPVRARISELEASAALEAELVEACAEVVVPARDGIITKHTRAAAMAGEHDALLRETLVAEDSQVLVHGLAFKEPVEGTLEYEVIRYWPKKGLVQMSQLALLVLMERCNARMNEALELNEALSDAELETVRALYSPFSDGAYTNLEDTVRAARAV